MSVQDHPSYRQYLIKENNMTDTNTEFVVPAERQESFDAVNALVTALYGADPALEQVKAEIRKSVVECDDREWNVTLSTLGRDISTFVEGMKSQTVDESDPESVDAFRAAREVREPLDNLAVIVSNLLRKQIGDNPVLNALLDRADEITARQRQERLDQEAAQPE